MAKNYWEQRVLADERRATEIAQSASDELAKMYRAQYLRVVKEIEKLKGEIDYGQELTRTQLWNYARWRKVEESLRDCVAESTRIGTDVIHEALEKEFERVIGDKVMNYGGAIGRNGLMALTKLEKNRILSGTWSGDHYSARIWKNTSAIADRMRNEITNMLVDGKSTQDIRRTVMREFGVGYHNADRLVRTEVSYVHNQMTLARYKANGDSLVKILNVEKAGSPEGSSGSASQTATAQSKGLRRGTAGKACEVCQELPGQPYNINAAPFLPAHPRCRCCYAPWTYSDRKKWAEEHPERRVDQGSTRSAKADFDGSNRRFEAPSREGQESIGNRSEIPDGSAGQNAPKPLQNQGFSGIMEVEKTDAPDWPSLKKAAEQIGAEAFEEYLKQTPIEQVVDANRVVEEAMRVGGKHHGKVENAQAWKASSIVKAVRSSQARVDEHRMKIENPAAHDAEWDKKDEGKRIGLLIKWRKDQRKNYELLQIFIELAKSRGLL